jgi:hypothetical protein
MVPPNTQPVVATAISTVVATRSGCGVYGEPDDEDVALVPHAGLLPCCRALQVVNKSSDVELGDNAAVPQLVAFASASTRSISLASWMSKVVIPPLEWVLQRNVTARQRISMSG